MAYMCTCLAFILTLLNLASLGFNLYLAFLKENTNDLTYAIIVSIGSYIFNLILISSFCITENECCEVCCPANNCCLYFENRKKEIQSKKINEKERGCCDKFCDCLGECCFIPFGSCIRKIGKQGTRYFALILLTVAHIGIAILCFYSTKRKNQEMSGDTIGIVIVCAIVTLANLFGIFAPCCIEGLRYQENTKTKSKSKNKNDITNANNTNNTNNENIIQVNNDVKEPFLQNQNTQNNLNNNSNDFYPNNNVNNNENNNDNNSNSGFNKVFGIKRKE